MEYFRTYDSLPEDAAFIRRSVFMEEQGFKDEFDDTDRISKHIVLYTDGDRPAAVCRYYPDGDGKCYIVGRIAVEKEFRGNHLGSRILSAAESEIRNIGGSKVRLHAQQQAKPFYEKQGYAAFGKPDFDEDCPHIWMEKSLGSPQANC